MKKIKIENKKINYLIKMMLIISCPFFTILLSSEYDKFCILVGGLISFFIFLFICIKMIDIKEIDLNKFFVSLFIGLYMIKHFLMGCSSNIKSMNLLFKGFGLVLSDSFILKLLGVLTIPIMIYFIYLFINLGIPKIMNFIKSFSKQEKRYFIIVLIVGIFSSIFITHFTSAFSMPTNGDGQFVYDVIYTSDSSVIVSGDAYFNVSHIENDIRQPLFGFFSLPFSVPAKILSEVCFFLTGGFEYAIIMTIIQFILISISIIMISRMMNIEEKDKKYLYLLFSCSFPYMIWAITLEQYVIATFYLITALYIYCKNKKEDFVNYYYVLAVGSLITSGIIFPIIACFNSIKQWTRAIFKCFLVFLSVFIISGQFPQILLFSNSFTNLLKNAGGLTVTLVDKLEQFFEFIKGMFIATPGYLYNVLDYHPSYRVVPVTSLWFLGILIFIICILGFILNRKNKFAQICILWIIFSMVILIGFGWGTKEKSLILYELYFSWAYLSLFFMFIRKVFKNKIFKIIMILLCLIILIFSVREFIEVLKFAFKYY